MRGRREECHGAAGWSRPEVAAAQLVPAPARAATASPPRPPPPYLLPSRHPASSHFLPPRLMPSPPAPGPHRNGGLRAQGAVAAHRNGDLQAHRTVSLTETATCEPKAPRPLTETATCKRIAPSRPPKRHFACPRRRRSSSKCRLVNTCPPRGWSATCLALPGPPHASPPLPPSQPALRVTHLQRALCCAHRAARHLPAPSCVTSDFLLGAFSLTAL